MQAKNGPDVFLALWNSQIVPRDHGQLCGRLMMRYISIPFLSLGSSLKRAPIVVRLCREVSHELRQGRFFKLVDIIKRVWKSVGSTT